MFRNGGEASGNGGLGARDVVSNGEEQLWQLPGEEEAIDEWSARFTWEKLPGGDKARPW